MSRERKEQRKITHLISQYAKNPMFTHQLLVLTNDVEWHNGMDEAGAKIFLNALKQINAYFKKKNFTKEEILDYVMSIRWQRNKDKAEYERKPVRVRKDNKTELNRGNSYNYHGNSTSIRFPKLVRKTAWKRFYKLFPHLLNKDNDK